MSVGSCGYLDATIATASKRFEYPVLGLYLCIRVGVYEHETSLRDEILAGLLRTVQSILDFTRIRNVTNATTILFQGHCFFIDIPQSAIAITAYQCVSQLTIVGGGLKCKWNIEA